MGLLVRKRAAGKPTIGCRAEALQEREGKFQMPEARREAGRRYTSDLAPAHARLDRNVHVQPQEPAVESPVG